MTIPDNYASVAHVFDCSATDAPMTTTHGIHNTGIATAEELSDLLGTVWTNDCCGSSLSDTYTYVGAYVLLNIGGVMQSALVPKNSVGTQTATAPSPAVSVGVKKNTTYAGKKYRGRMYLPAGYLTEATVSNGGVITSGTVDDIQTIMDNYLADINAGDAPMYLLHGSGLIDPTPVSFLTVRGNVRTQRRRQSLL